MTSTGPHPVSPATFPHGCAYCGGTHEADQPDDFPLPILALDLSKDTVNVALYADAALAPAPPLDVEMIPSDLMRRYIAYYAGPSEPKP